MSIATRTLQQVLPPALIRILARCITACCALMASVVWSLAWAQAGVGAAYPNKPVRIIVPSGAGSPGDFWARQIAAKFPEVFGQSLIVDNKPGANTFIAAEAAARAPADGYTLFLPTSATMVWNSWLFRAMPYRPVEDFTPITLVSGGPFMLAVNAQLPARTLGELIALAKAKPGELNYGMPGVRSDVFALMEQFKRAAGINVVGVPYKARGADLPDAVAGQIAITFKFWAALEPLVKAGRLRVLAVASPNRLPAAPDLPTFAEAGVAGIEMSSWSGLFVPAGSNR